MYGGSTCVYRGLLGKPNGKYLLEDLVVGGYVI